jgi:hypothetical protein
MHIDVRKHLLLCIGVAVFMASGCQEGPPPQDKGNLHSLEDIGRNAVITASYYVAVQRQLQLGKPDEAMKLIDSEYSRLLTQLREFDSDIEKEYRFRRLRDRVVTQLQKRWLTDPPLYLDELSVDYLTKICATIADCPRGQVRPLKESPEPPLPETD